MIQQALKMKRKGQGEEFTMIGIRE